MALVLGACAPLAQRTAGTSEQAVYVLNGLDRTVSRLAGEDGQTRGRSVPVPGKPSQIVAVGGDAFLVLSADERGGSGLLSFTRRGGAWTSRMLPLEPGAQEVLLAGAGPRFAVASYRLGAPVSRSPEAPARDSRPQEDGLCRVALVDLTAGTVAASHLASTTCGPGDSIRSIVGQPGAGGAVAYLGVWRWPVGPAEREAFGHGRVVKVDLTASGVTVKNVAPLTGAAEHLVLGAAGERPGSRLYALTMVPGPRHADWALARGEEYQPPQAWQLLGLHPDTLTPETIVPLRQPPSALTLTPDGRRAFGLIARDSLPATTSLLEIDLISGSMRHLATLAGLSLSLTASDDHLFATHSDASQIWVLDARTGRIVRTVAVGRHPVAVALAGK